MLAASSKARCFHLQDDEMSYATGRSMHDQTARAAYTVNHIADMIRAVYNERVVFQDGDTSNYYVYSFSKVGKLRA